MAPLSVGLIPLPSSIMETLRCWPDAPARKFLGWRQGTTREQSPRIFHGSSRAFRASFRIELPIRFFWVTRKA
jgi:hypothetical protein